MPWYWVSHLGSVPCANYPYRWACASVSWEARKWLTEVLVERRSLRSPLMRLLLFTTIMTHPSGCQSVSMGGKGFHCSVLSNVLGLRNPLRNLLQNPLRNSLRNLLRNPLRKRYMLSLPSKQYAKLCKVSVPWFVGFVVFFPNSEAMGSPALDYWSGFRGGFWSWFRSRFRRVPEQVPERVPERVAEQVLEPVPERVPEQVPEWVPERVPEQVPERIPEAQNI